MEVGHRRFYDSLLCPQVVGNLLYYRFLNPAVVAPDAFDIAEPGTWTVVLTFPSSELLI